MSNMKQLGLGLLMYAQDHDEMFCLGWNGGSLGIAGLSQEWPFAIYPYVKNAQLYVCPSRSASTWNPVSMGLTIRVSYGTSCESNMSANPSLGQVLAPAECILLGEVPGHRTCPPWHTTVYHNYYAPAVWPDSRLLTHNEGSNFAFYDGHAKWLKPSATIRDVLGAGPNMWNNAGR